MQKELESLGLSKNESKIYLFLLKNGSTTTGSIIKNTNISNSRVYETLKFLLNKGLVSYTVQKNGKHFQAVSPKTFLDIEEERKNKIETILPGLLDLEAHDSFETKTAIYEGFAGFKIAFKKIIDDCSNGGTIDILGFSKQQFSSESLKIFLSNMNLKSEKKNQKLRFILDQSAREWQGKDREGVKTNEVRYMPEGYISPAAIDVFQDYVYMFLWEERPFVFMIKNKRIAESFKQYFQFLWNIAKK
jgi:HTH-type transcriptional regulator, sugar sensing transcriptional regulator